MFIRRKTELIITMAVSRRHQNHDHYGPGVKTALSAFVDAFNSYAIITGTTMKYSSFRLDPVQDCWDLLVQERKKETGTGFYLTPQEYENVNISGSSNRKV
jgi:hypothetical protein